MKLKIDSTDSTINGTHKTLDVPAEICNGRTLVLARYIAESLGANVSWDMETQTVEVTM